ncbi:Gfo/Idh/MocA family oxidoreductase, partial [bacterium]|nr:Gfo/Idh/MocA family oxidoreductase [bacterium]
MSIRSLNVLIVGAGMYVCGRGTDGCGTILPALFEASKDGQVGRVAVVATSRKSIAQLKKKTKVIKAIFGLELEIETFVGQIKGFVPDCVIISVPDHLHFKIAKLYIEKGIPCLVVKPLAPTLKEVKELVALQKKNKVYGAVEFHKRYDRANLKLRDVLRSRLIGDPLYFVVEYSQRKIVPSKIFKAWVDQTNIFQYLGIHYIDIIYFATRAKPIRVMAVGQKNFLGNTHDSIQGVVEWMGMNGKKFTSTILTSWVDPESTSAMSDQKIKVIGTKGRYESDQKKRGIQIVSDDAGIEEPNPDFSAFYGDVKYNDFSFQGYGVQSITQFLKDIDALNNGKTSLAVLEEKRPTFSESIVP